MSDFRLFILSVVALFAMSCTTTPQQEVEQLDEYVTRVERDSDNYTEEDWARVDADFEELRADIEANYENMSPDQQRAAMRAVGRYYGLKTRRGIDKATRKTQEVMESVPSIIEGFMDALNR